MNFDSAGTLTGAEFGDICSPGVLSVAVALSVPLCTYPSTLLFAGC
jgi:hypothetical protein